MASSSSSLGTRESLALSVIVSLTVHAASPSHPPALLQGTDSGPFFSTVFHILLKSPSFPPRGVSPPHPSTQLRRSPGSPFPQSPRSAALPALLFPAPLAK